MIHNINSWNHQDYLREYYEILKNTSKRNMKAINYQDYHNIVLTLMGITYAIIHNFRKNILLDIRDNI